MPNSAKPQAMTTLAGSGTATIWIALIGARKPLGVVSSVLLVIVTDAALQIPETQVIAIH